MSLPVFARMQLTLLVDGPFHEETGAAVGVRAQQGLRLLFVLHQEGEGVMRDLAALQRAGTHLDGAHPTRLGQTGLDDRLVPRVHRDGLLGVLRRV